MNERTYPYNAWVLTPSFKPKEVTLAKEYNSYSWPDYGDLTTAGKLYLRSEIFPTKRDAVIEGWARVDTQAAKLDKMTQSLEKKRVALRKATGELGEPIARALPQPSAGN